jgi:hypothetical protein
MSSQTPDPLSLQSDIKHEENAGVGADATPSNTAPVSNYVSGTTLMKKDFDVMTNVIHRIINHRDQEYISCISQSK